MRRLLTFLAAILLAALLMAPAAGAASAWGICGSVQVADVVTDFTDKKIKSKGETECFYFNTTENSSLFTVTTESAVIMLYPDMGGDANADAAIDIVRCVDNTETYSANVCKTILDAALDGTGGAAGTQLASARVGPGTYAIRNSVDAGGDEAVVEITGE